MFRAKENRMLLIKIFGSDGNNVSQISWDGTNRSSGPGHTGERNNM